MGYAAAKTNTLLLTPANSNRLLHKTVFKTLAPHCTIDRIFLQVHWGHSPQPRGRRQARHTTFTSPTATPSPRLSFRRNKKKASGICKARPDTSTVPPLEAKPAGASLEISEGLEAPTRPPGRGAPGLKPPPAATGRGQSPACPPPTARTPALKRLRGSRWPKRLRS